MTQTMVGKRLLVNCMSKYKDNGVSYLTACKPKVYKIVAQYIDGRVKTSVGDVWKVKKHDGKEADYIVDEPMRG